MRPRPFLLLLAGVVLALMVLALPTASADITVYINEELMGEHNENTVTVESGQEIKIWIDLTDSHKENVSRLNVVGEYLNDDRNAISGVASYDAPGDNDIPPDYDRYYVKWPGKGTKGYARDGAYTGLLQITLSAQHDNGSLLGEQTMFVNILGDSGSLGFDYQPIKLILYLTIFAGLIIGLYKSLPIPFLDGSEQMNEAYGSLFRKRRKYEGFGGLLLLVGIVSILMIFKSLQLKGQWLVDEEGWHIDSLDLQLYSFLAIAGPLAGALYLYKAHNLDSDIEEVKMLIQVERDRSFNERREKRDRKREEKKKERKEQEIKQKIEWANKLRDKGGLANLIKARSIYSECNYDVKKIEIEIAKDKEEHLDYDGALLDFERLGLYKSAKRIRQKIQEQKKPKQTIIHGDYIDDRDTTYIDDRDTIVKDSVINRSNIGAGGKSKAELVQNIKELLDSGAIDAAEFRQMKKEILGK